MERSFLCCSAACGSYVVKYTSHSFPHILIGLFSSLWADNSCCIPVLCWVYYLLIFFLMCISSWDPIKKFFCRVKCFSYKKKKVCLFERQRGRDRSCNCWFTLQVLTADSYPKMSRAGRSRSQVPNQSSVSTTWVSGTQVLQLSPDASQGVCYQDTGSEAEPEPGPRHSTMGPRDPRWYLNHWPSALTLFWFWSPGYIFFATQCLSCQVSELVSLRFYTLLPESFESYEYVDRSRVDFV